MRKIIFPSIRNLAMSTYHFPSWSWAYRAKPHYSILSIFCLHFFIILWCVDCSEVHCLRGLNFVTKAMIVETFYFIQKRGEDISLSNKQTSRFRILKVARSNIFNSFNLINTKMNAFMPKIMTCIEISIENFGYLKFKDRYDWIDWLKLSYLACWYAGLRCNIFGVLIMLAYLWFIIWLAFIFSLILFHLSVFT